MRKTRVILSFDDGRKDNFDYAMPILRAHNLQATFNIATAYVDGSISDSDRPCPNEAMTVDDVLALYRMGHTIDAHGDCHKNDLEDIKRGIEKLREWGISDSQLGFASPNSKLSVEEILKEEKELKDLDISQVRVAAGKNDIFSRAQRKLGEKLGSTALFCNGFDCGYVDTKNDFIIYSVPIMHKATVKQIMAIIKRAIAKESDIVLMFHSISACNQPYYNDTWTWDIGKFNELCGWLEDMQEKSLIIVGDKQASQTSPQISVLLPVFRPNIADFDYALTSILKQSFADFELLLLYEPTDGDGVEDYLNKIDDDRIRLVYTPQGFGLPKSLNMGLEQARGAFIARMDADDHARENRFREQIDYLNEHPEIDVVGSWMQIMGSDALAGTMPFSPEQRKAALLFMNYGIAHPTAMIRREFLETNHIRYNESIRGSEDYFLWTDIVKNGGTIDCLRKVLLDYRISDTQASARLADKMVAWDALARQNLWMAYGVEDQDLIEQASYWLYPDHADNVDAVCQAFIKLQESTHDKINVSTKLLKKEMAFWWIYGILLRTKQNHGLSAAKIKYLHKLAPIRIWPYIVKRLMQKLKASPPRRKLLGKAM